MRCHCVLIPALALQEKWANFPRSRERLLSLLLQLPVRNPILLSGDVHYGELFTFPCTDSVRTIDVERVIIACDDCFTEGQYSRAVRNDLVRNDARVCNAVPRWSVRFHPGALHD